MQFGATFKGGETLFLITKNITSVCSYIKTLLCKIKRGVFTLLLSLFFITQSFAETTVPEINVDYLNNLTSPKVVWEEAAAGILGYNFFINGTQYIVTYNPYYYNEVSNRLNNIINTKDFHEKTFKNITYTGSEGGAVYNDQYLPTESYGVDLLNNHVANNDYAYGGSIYNIGSINTLYSLSLGNYVLSIGGIAAGGAIYNYGDITNLYSDFIGNYTRGSDVSYGGAIYNGFTLTNITGDFINNFATSINNSAYGGAIYNQYGNINNITGNFVYNYANGAAQAYGGAIFNYGSNATIGDITGDFSQNYAQGASAYGGAIYNSESNATIGNIEGDFKQNYAQSSNYSAYGGLFIIITAPLAI